MPSERACLPARGSAVPRPSVAAVLAVALLAAGSAQATPVAVQATLQISIQGLDTFTVNGSGSVDVAGGSLTVAPGLVSAANQVVPITSTSTVHSLVLSNFSNLSGAFSPGGATAQAPADICPGGGPAAGKACVGGGGLGGKMAVTGVVKIVVLPGFVTLPMDLAFMNIGEGGSASVPISTDAAPWTTGVARVATLNGAFSTTGANLGSSLSLVTATFVQVCGNALPILARFTLTGLVPEPDAISLVGAGLVGLSLLVRARRG